MTQPVSSAARVDEVGRIEGPVSQARVHLFESAANAKGPALRGLRIDLTDGAASDVVFVESARFNAVRTALYDIDKSARLLGPRLPPRRVDGTRLTRVQIGSAEFRRPTADANDRSIHVAQYVADGETGLALSAAGGRVFVFPGMAAVDLANVMDQALMKLTAQP